MPLPLLLPLPLLPPVAAVTDVSVHEQREKKELELS